jgi:glycosyltransferase involved in cell wall biosynthesis
MPLVLKSLDIRLVVCGEFYEGREETLALIKASGAQGAITLADRFIPNEEVGLYFSAADIVVLPYYSATQSGIVQVAYHYDKPVIITRVGGLPEVVPDGRTGFVVEPRDPDAVADAILRFYREKKEKVFVENVKAEKQKYSWDRMVEAIETLASMANTKSQYRNPK